jgi:hypothetical protein
VIQKNVKFMICMGRKEFVNLKLEEEGEVI